MSKISTIKMTARQFLELGEDPPGVRLELVDGEVAVNPTPGLDHSYVVTKLSMILGQQVETNDLGQVFGDVSTIFGPHDVRRPDFLYFSKRRLHLVGKKAMEGPPDLCVEIISESSGKIDRMDKFRQYQAGGVACYWIVDPEAHTLEGYKLQNGAYVPTGQGKGNDIVRLPPFPELEIPLQRLWRPQ